jgi:hypothetical protein
MSEPSQQPTAEQPAAEQPAPDQPAAEQPAEQQAEQPTEQSGEQVERFSATAQHKIKHATLPGTPVELVIGDPAQKFWKTNKGWVDGAGTDVVTGLAGGAVVGTTSMSHTGTPPTGFAGTAEVVDYEGTTGVWTGKGWT